MATDPAAPPPQAPAVPAVPAAPSPQPLDPAVSAALSGTNPAPPTLPSTTVAPTDARSAKTGAAAGRFALMVLMAPVYAALSPFLLFYSIGWIIGGAHSKLTDPTGKATFMMGELGRDLFFPYLVQLDGISKNLQGYSPEEWEEAQAKASKAAATPPKPTPPFSAADFKDQAKVKAWLAEPSKLDQKDKDGKYLLAELIKHWAEQKTDAAKAITKEIQAKLANMPPVTQDLIARGIGLPSKDALIQLLQDHQKDILYKPPPSRPPPAPPTT